MPRPLSLSIQDHLVRLEDWPWPLPWEQVFGRRAPLVLEIGFGNGEFLADQARSRPDRDHVGLELSWTAATHLFRRLSRDQLTNARGCLADAEVALAHGFAPDSLAEVFVNHPCPWPKARHERRRLLHPEGLRLLADRMAPGARLTVATDHARYADWLEDVLSGQDVLLSCHPGPRVTEIPGRCATKYQRKAEDAGLPIQFFEWRKVRAAGYAAPPALDPGEDMPTMTLTPAGQPPAEPFAGYEPRMLREEERGVSVTVRLGAVYRSLAEEGQHAWLVEALVVEDRLRQEFAIQVVRRKDGGLLIKPSGFGRPHPTHGVRRAIHALGSWLLERNTSLALAHENLGAALRD